MVSILFRSGLHKELKHEEKIDIRHEQGMTMRNVFEKMGIDETLLGIIIKDGLCIMPTDPVKDGDIIEIYPVYSGG